MSGWVEIPLRARDGSIKAMTKVSLEDADYLNRHRWKLTAKGYAQREMYDGTQWRSVRMHRAIMDLPIGDPRQVDHINRDKLDNRRENLRIVTSAEQRQNVPARGGSSPYRGVFRHSDGNWWGRVGETYVGYYADERECAAAVLDARRRLYPIATD